eukprot:7202651-Pyramimonas_sp.AAC.1
MLSGQQPALPFCTAPPPALSISVCSPLAFLTGVHAGVQLRSAGGVQPGVTFVYHCRSPLAGRPPPPQYLHDREMPPGPPGLVVDNTRSHPRGRPETPVIGVPWTMDAGPSSPPPQ